jgi:ATP-dependent helicase/nuclease subunit A
LREQDANAVEDAWHGDFAVSRDAAQNAAQSQFYMKKLPIGVTNNEEFAINSVANEQFSTIDDTTDDTVARIGQAMHRLLELYRPGLDLAAISPSIAASFALNANQAAQASQAAQTITQGEAAWVWDAAQIDWQANEVEIIAQAQLLPNPQLLRIDRLVKHTASQTWWVLDYKSNPAPQHVSELTAQLLNYKVAVQAANPQALVKAAFITAQGGLIEI